MGKTDVSMLYNVLAESKGMATSLVPSEIFTKAFLITPPLFPESVKSGTDSVTTTLMRGDCGEMNDCTTSLDSVLGSLSAGMSVISDSQAEKQIEMSIIMIECSLMAAQLELEIIAEIGKDRKQ